MNKNEFLSAIAEKADMKKVDAEKFYTAFVDVVTDALKGGDKVQLIGFGNFEIKDKAAREGINPATGAKIQIAASKVPAFKPSKNYKDQF